MTLQLSKIGESPVSWLGKIPIAHRGLHDKTHGIYENTLSAAMAAVENGYAIEVDLQPASDGVPMVFHDYTLDRLTEHSGNFREVASTALRSISIMNTNDCIPALEELFKKVSGKSPLVLELKGQKETDAGFVAAIAELAKRYTGKVAIMSFSHWLLEDAREIAPELHLGLTAEGNNDYYEAHRKIAESCNVDFLSYSIKDLDCDFVRNFRQTGRPVICWTIRTDDQIKKSKKYADQMTFEGFLP